MVIATGGSRVDSRTGFYEFARENRNRTRTALVIPGELTLSFGELADRVNAVSNGLRALGLGVGDVVAAAVHNGHEYFELSLATAQVGMYFVPISWRLSAAEIACIVQDCGADVFVAAEQVEGLSADQLPAHLFVTGAAVEGWRPYQAIGAGQLTSAPTGRLAGRIIGYTSGTTGRPKGVKWRVPPKRPEDVIERHLMPFYGAYGAEVGEGVHLVCSPLYHLAVGGCATGFLHLGHTLIVEPNFDAEQFLRDIDLYEVTSSHVEPTQLHRLLRLPDDTCDEYDISSLECLIHGGAPCPILIKQKMMDWLGPIVWEYLGSAEGLVSRVSPQEWIENPGTVGRPLAGISVAVVDDDGNELPDGEPGTIYFGTEGRSPDFEYLNDIRGTAASRRGNLVTAGDFGFVGDDGYLFLLDRRADLIVSGGVNIYPAEIEQYLILHPAVFDVAVVGIPDEEWGQQVLAVVQTVAGLSPGSEVAGELNAYCDDVLTSFNRPHRFGFLADFPRSETGKLHRRKIRELFVGTDFIDYAPSSSARVRDRYQRCRTQ